VVVTVFVQLFIVISQSIMAFAQWSAGVQRSCSWHSRIVFVKFLAFGQWAGAGFTRVVKSCVDLRPVVGEEGVVACDVTCLCVAAKNVSWGGLYYQVMLFWICRAVVFHTIIILRTTVAHLVTCNLYVCGQLVRLTVCSL